MPSSTTVPCLVNDTELQLKVEVTTSAPGYALFIEGNQSVARLSGTYGITEKIGVHAEWSRSFQNLDLRKNMTIGIGYSEGKSYRFQVFVLGGTGLVDYNKIVKGNYKSITFQPRMNFVSKNVISYLGANFKQMYYSGLYENFHREETEDVFFFEPSIGFVVDHEPFKVHFDIGISTNQSRNRGGYYVGIGISNSFY